MRIIIVTIFSIAAGLVSHLLFYPIVSSWRNERINNLGRPAIGVMSAAPAFLAWVWILLPSNADKEHTAVTATAAYLAAFTTVGSGVALGYLIDDLRSE